MIHKGWIRCGGGHRGCIHAQRIESASRIPAPREATCKTAAAPPAPFLQEAITCFSYGTGGASSTEPVDKPVAAFRALQVFSHRVFYRPLKFWRKCFANHHDLRHISLWRGSRKSAAEGAPALLRRWIDARACIAGQCDSPITTRVSFVLDRVSRSYPRLSDARHP